MKTLLQTLLCLTAFLTMTAFASDPILKIDSGGHQGLIRDIIITQSGDIISASDDKTIRVWDSSTGAEKRKILGQIGGGNEGKILAIALSADETVLAVGGYFSKGTEGEIRLYDYQSGKLLQLLKSHTDIVSDLAFDKEGSLYSANYDKSVKVWDLKSLGTDTSVSVKGGTKVPLPKTFSEHSNAVYAIKPLKNGKFVSAGLDKKIVLYEGKKAVKRYTHTQMLDYIAVSDRTIAACGFGNEILIFDTNLNLLKTITSPTVPDGLAFSPDGSKLVAGTGDNPFNVILYDVNHNFEELTTFEGHNNTTLAVAFLDNDTVVSGGGNDNEIILWKATNGEQIRKIVGNGKRIWRVGIEGTRLGFGNSWHKVSQNELGAIEKEFDLASMSLLGSGTLVPQMGGVKTPLPNFPVIDSSGLSHSAGGAYGYGDALLTLPNGKSILRDASTGLEHFTYGWDSTREFILSGGGNGHLKAYDNEGTPIADFIGHTGVVWNIAVDGGNMVSGSDDQVMNLWDLSSLRVTKEKEYDENIISAIIKSYNVSRREVIEKADLIKEKSGISIYKTPTISPKLSLFVGTDNEWIAWTKEGFFDASPNGAKYIGYHINKGSDHEAEFVSVDKLYKSFYRPDLIQKALAGESLESYAKEINIDNILSGGLAPQVAIKTPSGVSQSRDMQLDLEVCQKDNGGYDNLTLYLNGMAVSILDKSRGLKAKDLNSYEECVHFTPLISLQNGENKIGFKATNKTGTIESNLDEIKVTYKSAVVVKPNLHILAIGIDKYRDGDLQLKYSVADAKDLSKNLEKNGKKLFENVYTYELLDGDVTKANMLKKFKEIGAQTTREDVFVFYIAGHGITDTLTGAYFYLPVDFRYKNDESVRTNGVSQEDFTLALSQIQALKSITLIDTCNSGSFAEALASRGVLQKTAIDKLTRATGRATLVASSKDQVALEGFEGHGVFTYTVMEAMDGKGHKNGKITIKNLASYIEDTLPERTYQKWGYEQVPQSHITGTDFPIGVK